MIEKAIPVPLESNEILEIVSQELKKRLVSLSPLQGGKEYAGFEIVFNHTIRLFRVGAEAGSKETLAWGNVQNGDRTGESETIEDKSTFSTGTDVNKVREEHDLPLTIETSDGRGGKIRKKVKSKDLSKK